MNALRRCRLCADFWRIGHPFWVSLEGMKAAAQLGVVFAILLLQTYVNVLLNEWNGLFFNALAAKNAEAFGHQLARFPLLMGGWVLTSVYLTYIRQLVQVRWRTWLTKHYIDRWLSFRVFYHLQLEKNGTDNPDQRIAEDVNLYVSSTLNLLVGFAGSLLNLGAFISVLWALSGPLDLGGLRIPGYMLWAALAFAAVGTWLGHRLGRSLIDLDFKQQQKEADLRFSLVRTRENAMAVAASNGETQEARALLELLRHAVENYRAVISREKLVNGFALTHIQASVVFSYLIQAPRYFSGSTTLGLLTQSHAAFVAVETHLSWIIRSYLSLASWRATARRLVGFDETVSRLRLQRLPPPLLVALPEHGVKTSTLKVLRPGGGLLFRTEALHLLPGSRTWISGPSGCGKSTFLNLLAGLWPHYEGSIAAPASVRMLYLPQRPLFPIGPLREAVVYPDAVSVHEDSDIVRALDRCGLGHLAAELSTNDHWMQRLSPGEQQRLAFARALVIRPDWLLLDEATASLDEAGEVELYHALLACLPGATVISVAHRKAVSVFHDRRLDFQGDTVHGNGICLLKSIP